MRAAAAPRRPGLLWVLAAVCTIIGAPAHAQPAGRSPGEVVPPTIGVEIGWGEALIADRWNPIKIEVQGGGVVFDLEATAEVVMNGATVMQTLRRRAASTPGKRTAFHLGFIPPLNAAQGLSVRLRVVGRAVGSTSLVELYDEEWDGAGPMSRLPYVFPSEGVLIVSVGAGSLDGVARWRTQWTSSDPQIVSLVDADALAAGPADWQLYDAAAAVVLGPEAVRTVSEAQRRTLLSWVRAGGRVVLTAPGPAAPLGAWGVGDLVAFVGEDADEAPPGPGAPLVAASLTLTDAGRAQGWMVRPVRRATAAEGPLGLGWVVVLDGDPAPAVGGPVAADAWRTVLETAAAAPGSSPYVRASNRLDGLLNDAAARIGPEQASPVRMAAFVVVVTLGLALVLGPVDWFVLKRRHRLQLSWATSLGWIGVASVLGFVYPLVVRSAEPSAFSVTVRDVRGDTGESASSEFIAMFSTSSGATSMASEPAGSWWREVVSLRRRSLIGFGGSASDLDAGAPFGERRTRVWSFRAFTGEWIGRSPIRARVERDPTGALALRSSGVAEHAEGGLTVLTNAGASWIERGLDPDGRAGLPAPAANAPDLAAVWLDATYGRDADPACSMDGSMRRAVLLRRAIDSGRFALVCFGAVGPADERRLAGFGAHRARRLVRVLAPIIDVEDEADSEGRP